MTLHLIITILAFTYVCIKSYYDTDYNDLNDN